VDLAEIVVAEAALAAALAVASVTEAAEADLVVALATEAAEEEAVEDSETVEVVAVVADVELPEVVAVAALPALREVRRPLSKNTDTKESSSQEERRTCWQHAQWPPVSQFMERSALPSIHLLPSSRTARLPLPPRSNTVSGTPSAQRLPLVSSVVSRTST